MGGNSGSTKWVLLPESRMEFLVIGLGWVIMAVWVDAAMHPTSQLLFSDEIVVSSPVGVLLVGVKMVVPGKLLKEALLEA